MRKDEVKFGEGGGLSVEKFFFLCVCLFVKTSFICH